MQAKNMEKGKPTRHASRVHIMYFEIYIYPLHSLLAAMKP